MKKSVLVLIVLISFFSCNKDKKSEYISVEKKAEIEAVQEKKYTVTNGDTLAYAGRGLRYALSTQAVLGKNLMQAIQKAGTSGALSFCNEKAYSLTDSMAVVQNASIKRVSDKPRNLANQANAEELEYIETFKEIISNQESPNPIVKDSDTKMRVYYPILTNAMCLQCHGKPNKNIETPILTKLALLYPEDKAIGYAENEVRGIWSVSFNK
ncbi:uncharacterized protein DUF3365 [Gelidibacter algens]|uniref:Uncharacterized protein DUF3365 n=1 Tax=Gelidibacter algens TaxID=49280 RepID=A0A1A7QQN7_9FLAO|nr:DUF3365 domain-containing protein [Gelidibacter algens]OBX21633.1 hypothetical protein A9996_17885 [Gelidibacter algens]RAJ24740.1 uncharacterized protein DUF3365 [Gelidibacter algens]